MRRGCDASQGQGQGIEVSPRVSVNTIAKNAEATIADAIESTLRQSFQDFEHVLIDDGSADGTKRIMDEYAASDSRVRRIDPEPHATLGQLRNQALQGSRGEYIAVLDADDVSMPDRLEREAAFLDDHPDYVLVGGTCYLRRGPDEPLRPSSLGLITDPDLLHAMLPIQNTLAHSCVMYRRDAAIAAGGYDERLAMGQDYLLWLRLRERGRMTNLPRVVAIRRAGTGFTERSDHVTREAFALAARQIVKYERQARRLREGEPWEAILEDEEAAFAERERLAKAEWARAMRAEQSVWEINAVTRTFYYRLCRRLVLSPAGQALRRLARAFVGRRAA